MGEGDYVRNPNSICTIAREESDRLLRGLEPKYAFLIPFKDPATGEERVDITEQPPYLAKGRFVYRIVQPEELGRLGKARVVNPRTHGERETDFPRAALIQAIHFHILGHRTGLMRETQGTKRPAPVYQP
ncbi:MAG: hypothetical protein JSW08_03385 [archaeon]|nr:MAG: hypothetical protein JSW08_03385 [archaeon]